MSQSARWSMAECESIAQALPGQHLQAAAVLCSTPPCQQDASHALCLRLISHLLQGGPEILQVIASI